MVIYSFYVYRPYRLSLVPVDFDTLIPSPYRKSFLSRALCSTPICKSHLFNSLFFFFLFFSLFSFHFPENNCNVHPQCTYIPYNISVI